MTQAEMAAGLKTSVETVKRIEAKDQIGVSASLVRRLAELFQMRIEDAAAEFVVPNAQAEIVGPKNGSALKLRGNLVESSGVARGVGVDISAITLDLVREAASISGKTTDAFVREAAEEFLRGALRSRRHAAKRRGPEPD